MGQTILVVDDELGYRDWIKFELSGPDCEVFTASNGLEALGFLEGRKFDVIITDMKMPKMDGLETIVAIKKIHPTTPIIIITGHYDTMGDLVTKAATLSAKFYLQKPFLIEELKTTIQSAI